MSESKRGENVVVTLPSPAVKLARRIMPLAAKGNGRYKLELIFINNTWAVIVEGGKLEYLGENSH